ncbi:reverse transcriptase [Gossypium australe]|uniref:Reverse transcriptase n=1 Tax=Gossypium australe TaxID=47621 RepID=A0A5B6VWN2_9ROSI|nr:reverse transcriptase [Gossypium australe]
MYGFEKKGGVPRDERRIELLQKVLRDCNQMDVGFSGRWFTWERGNLSETNIRERLDRGVANEEWFAMFPEVTIQHLTNSFSNHCPLLVNTKNAEQGVKKEAFRFEAWWTMEESFDEEVKNIWGSSSGNLMQKLDKLKNGLRSWVVRTQADRKKDDLNLSELIDTKIQLNLEIDKDECYWEQRAHINWLKYGDRNTAFFHSQATHRRRRNLIHKMEERKEEKQRSFKI